jgi:hypothetical protein
VDVGHPVEALTHDAGDPALERDRCDRTTAAGTGELDRDVTGIGVDRLEEQRAPVGFYGRADDVDEFDEVADATIVVGSAAGNGDAGQVWGEFGGIHLRLPTVSSRFVFPLWTWKIDNLRLTIWHRQPMVVAWSNRSFPQPSASTTSSRRSPRCTTTSSNS